MLRFLLLAGLVAGALAARPAAGRAQTVGNPSFEEPADADPTPRPAGWSLRGAGYEFALDTAQRVDGRASLRSRRTDPMPYDSAAMQFGVAGQGAAALAARGRAVRLTGWIRTDAVTAGYAGLWLRVDGGAGRMLALDNMQARGPRGTTPWTRYAVELPVDSGAARLAYGVLHPGTGTAWFDSLRLEVVGPERPRRVADARPYEPPPRPAEDLTRLLTDAELALPPDPAAPTVDTAWAGWVRAHARPVRSLGAADFADLEFLRPVLAGRRVVQLGESGHGVREFNLAKVRLVKYLHERLGYDVLAFESSLFACELAGRRADSLDARRLMRACIFPVWHTAEVLALFEYVRETRRTPRPLVLTGFDVQASSPADGERAAFLWNVVGAVDTAYARRVRDTDGELFAETWGRRNDVYLERDGARLVAFYDSLAAWVRAREPQITAAFPAVPGAAALARQTAVSMSRHVRQLTAARGMEAVAIRDRGMADNLDVVLDELHPGKKAIVWAHNFHIQHRGFGAAGATAGAAAGAGGAPGAAVRTMGTYVAERRRHEVYTVGLFMYRGSAAHNSRSVYQVTAAAPGSLEAVLHRAPWRYAFVDLAHAPPGPGTAWMARRLTAKQWGLGDEPLVPRDEYDGLLFVDATWPPEYVP